MQTIQHLRPTNLMCKGRLRLRERSSVFPKKTTNVERFTFEIVHVNFEAKVFVILQDRCRSVSLL